MQETSCICCFFFFLKGLKTGSVYFPGGGVKYGGQMVNRALVERYDLPDDDEVEWQQNVDEVLKWFVEDDFDLVTLYYGEPDNVGHAKGPDHPKRKEIIAQIDRTIGYLREQIAQRHLTDRLNVIITSDHGMTTVKKRPLVDEIILNKYVNLLKLVNFEILDYGGFGILTPRPGKEEEVFKALSNAPNLTVYKTSEMPDSFHLAKSQRLPPIVVIADLGFNLNSVSSFSNVRTFRVSAKVLSHPGRLRFKRIKLEAKHLPSSQEQARLPRPDPSTVASEFKCSDQMFTAVT